VYSNSIKFKKSVAAILVKKHRNKMVNKETSNITNQCKQTQEADLKEKTSLVPIIDEITKYGSNTAIKKGRLNIYKNSTQLITSNILNANSQISINKRNKSVILTTCLMVICFTLCW
jgi:rRNA processing protein Krr1/Pno1